MDPDVGYKMTNLKFKLEFLSNLYFWRLSSQKSKFILLWKKTNTMYISGKKIYNFLVSDFLVAKKSYLNYQPIRMYN